ncbi:uncharacterized protein [Cherax quadricarinatus]|nr:uncharacterized protein LOC128693311 [Cherax quadricarinatus]
MNFQMTDLFSSISTIFAEADQEIDEWKASNKDLQRDIEELQQLVRSLTKNANDIHYECTKPREAAMTIDPSVKLRVGNTKAKVSLWEGQEAQSESSRTSGDQKVSWGLSLPSDSITVNKRKRKHEK